MTATQAQGRHGGGRRRHDRRRAVRWRRCSARPAKEPARVARPGEHNMPLTDLFEPGSTTKLITLVVGDRARARHARHDVHGARTPSRCDPDVDAVHRRRRGTRPSSGRRPTSCGESSNVGTIMIAQRMRNAGARRRAARVRLRHARPNDRLARPARRLCCCRRRSTTRRGKYSTAIGYGASVTGMQMLDAFTTIANDGVSRPPRPPRRDDRREGRPPPAPSRRPARASCRRRPRRR